MMTANKKLVGAICSISMVCGVLSNSQAATANLLLNWGATFAAKDSAGGALSTGNTTLKLGFFKVIPTDWTGVNLANLDASFTTLSSLSYSGAGQYVFSIDTAIVAAGVSPADAEAQFQAFLAVTSGSTQLGIFDWFNSSTPFYLPRDPGLAPGDLTSLTTNFGKSRAYNMVALVGSVSSSGITTASAAGAVTSPQSITSFSAIPSKTVGESFTLNATATSGLAVTYASSNTNVATVSGNVVTIVGTGPVTITASQVGNSSYDPATSVPQQFVSYASTALQLASSGTPVLNAGQTSVTHNFVGNPNSTYTIEYKSDLSASTWSSVTAQTGANGSFSATFTTSGDLVNTWKNRMFFRAKNS
jgi:hypothetical protein